MATPSGQNGNESGAYKFFIGLFGKEGKGSILIPTIVFISLMLLVGVVGYGTIWAGVTNGFLSAIYLLYVFQGWVQSAIAFDPTSVGLVTLFGKFTGGVKQPGDRFFPLRGLVYNYEVVDVTRQNLDLETNVITPDRASSRVSFSVTYEPVSENGDILLHYVKSGKREGVQNILSDIARGRIREWAASSSEGPDDWLGARESGDEAVAVLLRRLNGWGIFGSPTEQKAARDSNISISALYKMRARKSPNAQERTLWSVTNPDGSVSDWGKLEEIVLRNTTLSSAVDNLMIRLSEATDGNAQIVIQDLGIQITRFTLKDIVPLGGVAEKAELQAKEREERKGEMEELNHVKERIKELKELGFSPQEAAEIVQIERKKVTKTVSQQKLDHHLSADSGILDVAKVVAEIFAKRT